jgi:hypothetical protein
MTHISDKEKCREDVRNRLEEAFEDCKPKPTCQEEAHQNYADAKESCESEDCFAEI